MPRTRIEAILGRPGLVVACWLAVAVAVAASVLLWGAALERPISPGLASVVPILVSLPVVCWAFAGLLMITTARRRTDSTRLGPARGAAPHGVVVPGRRGHTLALLIAVGSAAAFCLIAAATVGGGWAILWCVCAAAFLVATVSTAIASAHPRRLVLHENGVGSASFLSDAAVQWGDIERIEYTEGAAGLMVLRVHVIPDATSVEEPWRHPFLRRRGTIDIEPLALGIDGTLLWLALRLYATDPRIRHELASGRAPARLFDPAVGTVVPAAVAHPVLDVFRPAGSR